MPARKLRVGVIGPGMGRGHVRGFRQHAGCEVVAVADTDISRLVSVGQELGISGRYTDGVEMLEKENLGMGSYITI